MGTKMLFRVMVISLFVFAFWQRHTPVRSASSSVLRVSPDGADITSCGSAAEPCRTIQYAVHRAASGSTVLVAAGTYTYDSSVDTCDFLISPAVLCLVDKDLTIQGGYTSGNWDTADPERNLTVIDGEGMYRGVAVIAYNTLASLYMDGFTIQNGYVQGLSHGSDFQINATGGGIWAQNSSVSLHRVALRENTAVGGDTNTSYGGAGNGGALAIQSSKNGIASVLEEVIFEGNSSVGGQGNARGGTAIGGALFVYDAVVNARDLYFSNNAAYAGDSVGDGFYNGLRADALGGALGIQENAVVNLDGATFLYNKAVGGDAGDASDAQGGLGGGGAVQVELSQLSMRDVSFRFNEALGGNAWRGGHGFGGAVLVDSSKITAERLYAIGNEARSGDSSGASDTASVAGGGLYLTTFHAGAIEAGVSITNAILADNSVEFGYPNYSPEGGGGGGMVCQAIDVTAAHVTLANNHLGPHLKAGQAIVGMGLYGTSGEPCNLVLENSIVSDHRNDGEHLTSAISIAENSSATLDTVLFSNNTHDINTDGNPYPPGAINLSNILTSTLPIGYLSMGPPEYDYRLADSSVAIDRAFLSGVRTDIENQPRPYGPAPDIGADEFVPPSLVVTPPSFVYLTDSDTVYAASLSIDVSYGQPVTWTAQTSDDWLFLGENGNLHSAAGTTGETITVRASPANLAVGTYVGTVQFTSPRAQSFTWKFSLFKVSEVYTAFLPLVMR